jgi:hypothetical protein
MKAVSFKKNLFEKPLERNQIIFKNLYEGKQRYTPDEAQHMTS